MKITAKLLNPDGVPCAEGELAYKDFDLGDGTTSSQLFSEVTNLPYRWQLVLPNLDKDPRCPRMLEVSIEP